MGVGDFYFIFIKL